MLVLHNTLGKTRYLDWVMMVGGLLTSVLLALGAFLLCNWSMGAVQFVCLEMLSIRVAAWPVVARCADVSFGCLEQVAPIYF